MNINNNNNKYNANNNSNGAESERGKEPKAAPAFCTYEFRLRNQSPRKCVRKHICAGCMPKILIITMFNVLLRVLLVMLFHAFET